MKKIKRIFAAIIALLILTSLTAVSAFAENETDADESSPAVESSSSAEAQSSSPAEEQSSSSAEEKSSSSAEEESSSSEEESESSEEEESESSAEERRSSSGSSVAEEAFAQVLTHDSTGVSVGLSQPNDRLLIEARSVSANDAEAAEAYSMLLGASKDKELVCCYEVILGGDDAFNSKVTVVLPVDGNLIDRSMAVLFYADGAKRVETSNKTVSKIGAQPAPQSDSDEEPAFGYLKVTEKLESGKKYYFAVCEFADYVPVSGGFGILEILVILIGVAALVSGGLLAFLWVRYNKKQQKKA